MTASRVVEWICVICVSVLLITLFAVEHDRYGSDYAHVSNEMLERMEGLRESLNHERDRLRDELHRLRLMMIGAAFTLFIIFVIVEPMVPKSQERGEKDIRPKTEEQDAKGEVKAE